MRIRSRNVPRLLACAASALWLALAAGAQAQELEPRGLARKPVRVRVGPGELRDRIALKLADETEASFSGGELVSARADLAPLREALRAFGVRDGDVERISRRAPAALHAARARGELRSRRRLADRSLYLRVRVPRGADAGALCDALNALDAVESAQPWPRPLPAPVDLAPPTPDWSAEQTYTQPAPAGIGSALLAGVIGADGATIRIVDIEYEWRLDHEDLELPPSARIDALTLVNPYPDQGDHGNAVLGILAARPNAYGVTGLAPAAQVRVTPSNTDELSWDVGAAVDRAVDVSSPGDVILIEQQICVCGNTCPAGSQSGAGPVEWFGPWRAAIEDATAQGIHVVEAAGNGGADLDAPGCNGAFDRELVDSGAVIVGAGASASRAPMSYASYGSRVDVQAWADGVTTTGDGGLFDPGDVRQRYQANFGGSSAASAIVAGALLVIEGSLRGANRFPLGPTEARALLRATGTPQAPSSRQIGPLPNVPAAFLAALAEPVPALEPGLALALGVALGLGALAAARARSF